MVERKPWRSGWDVCRDCEVCRVGGAGDAGENCRRRGQAGRPENLAGKTIIDTTNPLTDAPPVDGVLEYTTGPNESLGEKIQASVPKSHVVKAFNSVGAAKMVNPHYEQGTPTMFLCGANADAKALVSKLIDQFGWEPFDCGGIIAARALEPLCMLWCIPGFRQNQWGHAFKLLNR
jgi:predicted dinucleotide-binding enzyme